MPLRVLALIEAKSVTGPAKNVLQFARQAQVEGHGALELSVCTFVRGTSDASNPFIEAARGAGLKVHVISEQSAFDPRIIGELRSVVERICPDIIQTHSCKSHFLVRLSGLHRRYRWVAFHHGYTWTDLRNRAYNQLDRWSLRKPRLVITVCQPFAAQLSRIGVPEERIIVQHNTVRRFVPPKPEETMRTREMMSISPSGAVILSVGRLSREKAHIDLVEAVGHLKRQKLDRPFTVVIVGDGPERDRIRQRAEKLNIADHLRMVGAQADVSPFYAMADMMVLPSHSEGCPNVLLEAMAAGIPSIATRVGGVSELVQDEETALLVDKEDIDGLANAIGRALQDPALRGTLGKKAREAALRCGPKSYYKSMLENYERVLKVNRHPLQMAGAR